MEKEIITPDTPSTIQDDYMQLTDDEVYSADVTLEGDLFADCPPAKKKREAPSMAKVKSGSKAKSRSNPSATAAASTTARRSAKPKLPSLAPLPLASRKRESNRSINKTAAPSGRGAKTQQKLTKPSSCREDIKVPSYQGILYPKIKKNLSSKITALFRILTELSEQKIIQAQLTPGKPAFPLFTISGKAWNKFVISNPDTAWGIFLGWTVRSKLFKHNNKRSNNDRIVYDLFWCLGLKGYSPIHGSKGLKSRKDRYFWSPQEWNSRALRNMTNGISNSKNWNLVPEVVGSIDSYQFEHAQLDAEEEVLLSDVLKEIQEFREVGEGQEAGDSEETMSLDAQFAPEGSNEEN